MAMTTCPDCSREISDRAPFCVGCGAPSSVPWWQAKGRPRHGAFDGIFTRLLNNLVEIAILLGVAVPLYFLYAR